MVEERFAWRSWAWHVTGMIEWGRVRKRRKGSRWDYENANGPFVPGGWRWTASSQAQVRGILCFERMGEGC